MRLGFRTLTFSITTVIMPPVSPVLAAPRRRPLPAPSTTAGRASTRLDVVLWRGRGHLRGRAGGSSMCLGQPLRDAVDGCLEFGVSDDRVHVGRALARTLWAPRRYLAQACVRRPGVSIVSPPPLSGGVRSGSGLPGWCCRRLGRRVLPGERPPPDPPIAPRQARDDRGVRHAVQHGWDAQVCVRSADYVTSRAAGALMLLLIAAAHGYLPRRSLQAARIVEP
jgi:hypothetical protein